MLQCPYNQYAAVIAHENDHASANLQIAIVVNIRESCARSAAFRFANSQCRQSERHDSGCVQQQPSYGFAANGSLHIRQCPYLSVQSRVRKGRRRALNGNVAPRASGTSSAALNFSPSSRISASIAFVPRFFLSVCKSAYQTLRRAGQMQHHLEVTSCCHHAQRL